MRDEDMYAEAWEILSHFNPEERARIPDEILRFLDLERNRDYVSRIDPKNLFNPANIHQRTINLLTWLMMDYMAGSEDREELIRIGKENDRRNGSTVDAPEENRANFMTGHTDHADDGNLNHRYYELLDIEDRALRKKAFKQLESKCSDVYFFNGSDELELFSNFLALRLKGPLTIEGNQCRVPVKYRYRALNSKLREHGFRCAAKREIHRVSAFRLEWIPRRTGIPLRYLIWPKQKSSSIFRQAAH